MQSDGGEDVAGEVAPANLRILVVDSVRASRLAVTSLLEEAGYQARPAFAAMWKYLPPSQHTSACVRPRARNLPP